MNKKALSILLLLVFLGAPLTSSYGFLARENKQEIGNKQVFGNSKVESKSSSSSSGWLRSGIGGGGDDPLNPGDPNAGEGDHKHNDAPLGNGLWMLLPLAAGYAVLGFSRNRSRSKSVNLKEVKQ